MDSDSIDRSLDGEGELDKVVDEKSIPKLLDKMVCMNYEANAYVFFANLKNF
jgi:hypothetical protein